MILTAPHGPCLTCLGELDAAEIARWARPLDQGEFDRLHSYGAVSKDPSVAYLDGLTVNAALAELAAWLSGARPPAQWLDIDVVGDRSGREPRSTHARSAVPTRAASPVPTGIAGGNRFGRSSSPSLMVRRAPQGRWLFSSRRPANYYRTYVRPPSLAAPSRSLMHDHPCPPTARSGTARPVTGSPVPACTRWATPFRWPLTGSGATRASSN